jgi:O-acetylhomoserine (thiol)-lyase
VRAVPIYQTTSFVFDSPEHAASLFNICESGDEIVAARTLYGGTHTQLNVNFRKLGINTIFVDPDDPENFARAITPRTKALYAETVGNPSLNVIDLEALGRIAEQAGLPLFIDNTFVSPSLCQPFKWGAAVVLHSATKFLGGHGTSMGGIIVESGNFPWDNGKFATMTEPSPGYHGVRFYETFGDFGFTMKCRMEGLRTFGPVLSPFNAFLLLQGVETLSLRMERHCSNALALARWLQDHPKVAWVNYPGLADSRYAELAKKYLPKGAGAVLTFGIKGGASAGQTFINSIEFISHLANIGDAKTLVIHPASTTHRQLSEEQQIAAGVPPDLIRLSVGLEDLADIMWDLDQALTKCP